VLQVVEDCGPELTVGAVVLVRCAAIVHHRTDTGIWFLNVTPNNLAMLWPVETRYMPHLQPAPPIPKAPGGMPQGGCLDGGDRAGRTGAGSPLARRRATMTPTTATMAAHAGTPASSLAPRRLVGDLSQVWGPSQGVSQGLSQGISQGLSQGPSHGLKQGSGILELSQSGGEYGRSGAGASELTPPGDRHARPTGTPASRAPQHALPTATAAAAGTTPGGGNLGGNLGGMLRPPSSLTRHGLAPSAVPLASPPDRGKAPFAALSTASRWASGGGGGGVGVGSEDDEWMLDLANSPAERPARGAVEALDAGSALDVFHAAAAPSPRRSAGQIALPPTTHLSVVGNATGASASAVSIAGAATGGAATSSAAPAAVTVATAFGYGDDGGVLDDFLDDE